MANKKTFPFEATLEKLEGIVETMESGDLSLEESLRAFEEGIQLTRLASRHSLMPNSKLMCLSKRMVN